MSVNIWSESVNYFSRGGVWGGAVQYEIINEIVDLRVYTKLVKRLCTHISLVSNRL